MAQPSTIEETSGVSIIPDPIDTIRQRDAELRQQSETAGRMISGQDEQSRQAMAILAQTNPAEYQRLQEGLKQEKRAADALSQYTQQVIKAQENLQEIDKRVKSGDYTVNEPEYQAYKESVNKAVEAVEALTNPKLKPLVDFSKSGGYSIDVYRARKQGVDIDLLVKAGMSRGDILLQDKRIERGQGPSKKYIKPDEAELKPALERIIYREEKRKFEAATTKLKDGYLPNTTINEIKQSNAKLYGILMDEGIEAYNREAKRLQSATENLSKYPVMVATYNDKGIKTYRPSMGGQVDLVQAYKDGRASEIRTLYGEDTIRQIKDYLDTDTVRQEFSKYTSLNTALMGGMSEHKLERIFTREQINETKKGLRIIFEAEKNLAELQLKVDRGERLSFDEQQARANNMKVLTDASSAIAAADLAVIIPQGINRILSKVDIASRLVTEKMPAVVSIPTRYAIGWFVERPLYATAFGATALGIIGQTNPVKYAGDVANGIGDFFKTIPGRIKADPESAANLVGVFVAPSTIKSIAARTIDPGYVPYDGISYAFRADKLPVTMAEIQKYIRSGKLTEVKIANAIYKVQKALEKNPKADATIKIKGTNLEITAKTTPWIKRFGSTMFHAAPDYSPFLKDFIVKATNPKEPALFGSQHAAGRFAVSSAGGVPGTNPVILSLFLKNGIKQYPALIRAAKDLTEMGKRGFEYLGSGKAKGVYSAIKTYAERFENEILAGVGTEFVRVKNLRSRILGIKAGEFVTVVNDKIVPIMRYAEKGAKVPDIPLSKLAALRVEVLLKTVKRLRMSKYLSLYLKQERGLSLADIAAEFEKAGKNSSLGKIGPYASDASAIKAVANGTKPVAEVINTIKNRTQAKLSGLQVKVNPNDTQFIQVAQKSNAGVAAINTLQKIRDSQPSYNASNIVKLKYDIELGKAFGYSKADIAAFIQAYYDKSLINKYAKEYNIKVSNGVVEKVVTEYRRSVDNAMASELRQAYDILNKNNQLERYYASNKEEFERAYSDILERRLADVYETKNIRPPTQRSTTMRINRLDIPVRAEVSGRRDISERELRQAIERIEALRENVERVETIRPPERADIDRIDIPTPPERIKPPDRIEEPEPPERVPPPPDEPPLRAVPPSEIKPPYTPIDKPKYQKQARKKVREADLALGWRQGQLHGKDRYDVILNPFEANEEYLIIMGRRPQGLKLLRGPRSAYNTAQTITGKVGKAGIVDIPGIMSAKIWPSSDKKVSLQFVRDANISGKKAFPLERSKRV
jgi:hypothetical protein